MEDGTAAVPPGEDDQYLQYHAYLLLSFQGSTKVLATGEELREVTERRVPGAPGRCGVPWPRPVHWPVAELCMHALGQLCPPPGESFFIPL